MTILGVHIVGPDRALAWCDSQVFTGDVPAGHACKLSVNALACSVGIGRGRFFITERAHRVIAREPSFDDAVARLPHVLRRKHASAITENPTVTAKFVVCGYSHYFRRLVAFILTEPDYEPEQIRSICLPDDPELDSMHPHDLDDITSLALCQIASFQRDFPGATGGCLVGAVVTSHGVMARPLLNLASGLGLHISPNLSAGAS